MRGCLPLLKKCLLEEGKLPNVNGSKKKRIFWEELMAEKAGLFSSQRKFFM